MPSVFETSPTAIPITFVTKSSWDQVAERLPAAQRQFAAASAFTAKPGGYLALPAPDGAIAQVLFGLEAEGARSRDLINTPANDMGPEELAAAAQDLAAEFGASFACTIGDDLKTDFPLIHA